MASAADSWLVDPSCRMEQSDHTRKGRGSFQDHFSNLDFGGRFKDFAWLRMGAHGAAGTCFPGEHFHCGTLSW